MLKQVLALSLFFVLSSNAMNDELRISRNNIMNEFYVASKENRSPSPVVIQEMEQIADQIFEHGDADLLVVGAPYLSKGTLLRMSDGCVQKLRANALSGESNIETAAILGALTRNLQKKGD
jgi:nucleotide-binding universal stress UspA family protein